MKELPGGYRRDTCTSYSFHHHTLSLAVIYKLTFPGSRWRCTSGQAAPLRSTRRNKRCSRAALSLWKQTWKSMRAHDSCRFYVTGACVGLLLLSMAGWSDERWLSAVATHIFWRLCIYVEGGSHLEMMCSGRSLAFVPAEYSVNNLAVCHPCRHRPILSAQIGAIEKPQTNFTPTTISAVLICAAL